jgi:hypothetical protein
MGLWTRSSVVVYRFYPGPTEMEGYVTCSSSARGGSRTRELDVVGQRDR